MISFVIPAYNAEKSIDRAINSILNQKKSKLNYEIIVVNDGSSDNINSVLKKYEDNEKIKYYVKENTGVADTRNYGVQKANGEYIIFVDSDDYISANLLQDIENYIDQKIELIKWNSIFVDENKIEKYRMQSVPFEKSTGEEGFNHLFGKDNLLDCLWNYAIKKENMLEFPKRNLSRRFCYNAINNFKIEEYGFY